jgi:hypothetical protein
LIGKAGRKIQFGDLGVDARLKCAVKKYEEI